jgi:hypothetical protein
MDARIDEKVARRFRASAESLRNLDAVLLTYPGQNSLRYDVTLKNGETYTTRKIDEILKHRNARPTRIVGIIARLSGSNVKILVTLGPSLHMTIEGSDRAEVTLFAQRLRTAFHDDMALKRSLLNFRFAIPVAAVVGFIVSFTGCVVYSDHQARHAIKAEYQSTKQSLSLQAAFAKQAAASDGQALANLKAASVIPLTEKNASIEKLNALLSEQARQLEAQVNDENGFAQSSEQVSLQALDLGAQIGLLGLLGISVGGSITLAGLAWLIAISSESKFLIGHELTRWQKHAALRGKVYWGVVVAAVVGYVVNRIS